MKGLCIGIFCLLLFLFTTPAVAQGDVGDMFAIPTPTVSPTPIQPSYVLPYPGILPDNPFYFLKTARDRIVGFLVSNPEKKAAFNLLQADKRLQMGVYLFEKKEKGKQRLAESTIAKGENYFEEAIGSLYEAKRQGMPVTDMGKKMLMGAQKHKQILQSLQKRAEKAVAKDLAVSEKRVDGFIRQLQSFVQKK